ncbi:DUF7305 domain-containing protein [Halomonas sp. NPDC076908]|uniref:DUF7305 domain-containing protein n=1 Tax=Halomonas sp. NPDC076908 TaxID=3390567 RepID=UPI003D057EC3
MKHQQGAALVIVMALLSGALMLGMSGMQSALIDERLAGNYRAAVQAQMNSDSLMSEFSNTFPLGRLDNIYESGNATYEGSSISNLLDNADSLGSLDKLKVSIDVDKEKGIITVITTDQGTNNNAVRQTVATYQRGNDDGSGSEGGGNNGGDVGDDSSDLFEVPFVGCEGMMLSGGSTVSSYRSSDGNWSGQPGRFAEENVPLIRTTTENADVFLEGNEQVHGGVMALGSVTLNGSSAVYGDVSSNNNVIINTSNFIHGNVNSKGKVDVNNSATVSGSIFSNGNVALGRSETIKGDVESSSNIIFSSSGRVDGSLRSLGRVSLAWGASIGRGIYAQNGISSPGDPRRNPPQDHIDAPYRNNFFPNTSVSLAEVEEVQVQSCDIVNFSGRSLLQEITRYKNDLVSIGNLIVNNGVVDITMTPSQISVVGSDSHGHVDGAEPSEVTIFGEDAATYYVADLSMASTSKLHIKGGDVVLVVGGDFSMGGGGAGLVIDENSSLTVFVAGKVDFGSVLNMPTANAINSNGKPTFSIFSGYSGSGTGVNFSSSNRVVANIYAPYANVSVNSGASFFGSIRGRTVSVSGGGSIVYDELLAESFGDTSNGSPKTGGDGGWQLVGWQ